MAQKIEREDEVFFVGIRDPVEVRKTLLENTRDVVQILQRFERFKQVREEKAQEVLILKNDIKELNRLVNKLKSSLPKTKIRIKLQQEEAAAKKQKPVEEKKKVEKKQEVPVKKKELSDLEKLERELGDIEGRLSKLS